MIVKAGRQARFKRWIIATVLMSILVALLCIAMLLFGNTFYSLNSVIKVLLGENIQGATFAIKTLRFPRMLAGLFSGFAFGLAGSTFQTLLRNPLASPNIIGISAGSSAAAVFCILVLNLSGFFVSFAAVIAGLLTTGFIYFLSRRDSFSGGRLILIGIGIQAMLNALVSYLLKNASNYDVPAALRWLSGSLNGIQLRDISTLIIPIVIFAPIILLLQSHLRILELGEQSAVTLGINADKTRIALLLSSVCLIAFATATTGPIAFVAFLSGPIAKKLVGVGFSNEFPAGIIGAVLVLGADLIGQFAFDTRFPAGVITGLLGAPFLLFLLIRMNRIGGI